MEVDYNSLRVFGCACWPNLRPYNAHKLAFRSKQCAFLGYSNLHKGFKCLDIASGRIYISRDVVFDESIFPFAKLNPNAGARFRSELLLLPSELLNYSSSWGVQMHDNVSSIQPDDNTNNFSSFQEENPGNLSEDADAGGIFVQVPGAVSTLESGVAPDGASVRGASVSASAPATDTAPGLALGANLPTSGPVSPRAPRSPAADTRAPRNQGGGGWIICGGIVSNHLTTHTGRIRCAACEPRGGSSWILY